MEEKNYFDVVVEYTIETEDRHGNRKVKRTKEKYLVNSQSVEHATHKMHEFLGKADTVERSFEIVSVKQAKYEGII